MIFGPDVLRGASGPLEGAPRWSSMAVCPPPPTRPSTPVSLRDTSSVDTRRPTRRSCGVVLELVRNGSAGSTPMHLACWRGWQRSDPPWSRLLFAPLHKHQDRHEGHGVRTGCSWFGYRPPLQEKCSQGHDHQIVALTAVRPFPIRGSASRVSVARRHHSGRRRVQPHVRNRCTHAPGSLRAPAGHRDAWCRAAEEVRENVLGLAERTERWA
jgi:hypothetical protein